MFSNIFYGGKKQIVYQEAFADLQAKFATHAPQHSKVGTPLKPTTHPKLKHCEIWQVDVRELEHSIMRPSLSNLSIQQFIEFSFSKGYSALFRGKKNNNFPSYCIWIYNCTIHFSDT